MSIHSKYDLALIGNAIIDDIYYIDGWNKWGTSNIFITRTTSIGGIGNIINELDNSLHIHVDCVIGNDVEGQLIYKYFQERKIIADCSISNNPTSKALILTDLQSSERTSFVNWGCGKEIPSTNNQSEWTHISYLDVMPSLDLNHIKKNTNTLSADLCLSHSDFSTINLIKEQLHYLDYLFISESEIDGLIGDSNIIEFVSQFKLKCMVFHTREKTFLIKDAKRIEVNNPFNQITNVNVLGAGDAYCAGFISYQLTHSINDSEAALYAHKQATDHILRGSL